MRKLLAVTMMTALLGCGGSDEKTVSGTVSLGVEVTDKCVLVALDDDVTGANGAAGGNRTALWQEMPVTGSSFSYTFSEPPEGTYFVWAFLDMNGNAADPSAGCAFGDGPDDGDLMGVFGATGGLPSAPNVEVPHEEGATFDFTQFTFME